jgi:AcrR family transcriptional regulator
MSRPRISSVADITDTQTAILAAAIDILQREGAGSLTVRSVASLAGCSTTGVYTWFGGKNGLVDAIFIDGFQRFGQAVDAVLRRADPLAWLTARALAYREWALANPTHYMVMFGKAVPDYEPSESAMLASIATFESMVAATGAAIDAGKLTGEPFDVAHHLWAGIHGYVSLELAGMDLGESPVQRARTYKAGVRRLLYGCAPRGAVTPPAG